VSTIDRINHPNHVTAKTNIVIDIFFAEPSLARLQEGLSEGASYLAFGTFDNLRLAPLIYGEFRKAAYRGGGRL